VFKFWWRRLDKSSATAGGSWKYVVAAGLS
jgi:hypothetical protein